MQQRIIRARVQADVAAVPSSVMESSVRQAFQRRGLRVDPSADFGEILAADSRFVRCGTSESGGSLVRTLSKGSALTQLTTTAPRAENAAPHIVELLPCLCCHLYSTSFATR